MMQLGHEAWSAIGHVLPGLTDPHRVDPFNRVITAIHDDNVNEYRAARAACGKTCDPDMERNDEERQFIDLAIQIRAWPILAAQIQSAPQIAQRLLHTAGSDFNGYEGATDLVNFLLTHGAKADGLALANAVVNCRAGMTEMLLQNGASAQGRYSAPGRFTFDGLEDVVEPPRSLLTFAAEQHCDAVVSDALLKHGADRKDIEPSLVAMKKAISKDNVAAYESAWQDCERVDVCTDIGTITMPYGDAGWSDNTRTKWAPDERAWIHEATMANAWHIVAVQIGRMSPKERDALLSAAPQFYPDKPELVTLLRKAGAQPDPKAWTAPIEHRDGREYIGSN